MKSEKRNGEAHCDGCRECSRLVRNQEPTAIATDVNHNLSSRTPEGMNPSFSEVCPSCSWLENGGSYLLFAVFLLAFF